VKSSPRSKSAFLALAILAIAASPCLAGDEPKADDTKVPVIRVVVDRENHLALVPKGTVLPGGLQILSSTEETAGAPGAISRSTSVQRPLVFAYAPAERLAGLEPVEIPRDESSEVAEFNGPAEPGTNATKIGNPCPVTIVVEFGPEMTHEMTCSYTSSGSGLYTEKLVSYTTYPTTATRSRINMVVDYAPPRTDTSYDKVCVIPAGACTSWTFFFGVPTAFPTNVVSNASVRLPGACTQDPPYCPFFSSSIVLPVLAP
jgi:hypothetical protein